MLEINFNSVSVWIRKANIEDIQDETVYCGFVSKSNSVFDLVRAEDGFTVSLANAASKPGDSLQTPSQRSSVWRRDSLRPAKNKHKIFHAKESISMNFKCIVFHS